MEYIAFASTLTGEEYVGFVLKEKNGRVKIGRTAGFTHGGRFQNWFVHYWFPYKHMTNVKRIPPESV